MSVMAHDEEESEVVQGIVVHHVDLERFAQGMVESSTEYDFADLPLALQEQLVAFCREFWVWIKDTP